MGTHKNKSEIAWLMTLLMERDTSYSAQELDALIRQNLRSDLLNDPIYAPDHIRLAMLENQFVERDESGRSYRVAPLVLLTAENEQVYRDLIEKAWDAQPSESLTCPLCNRAFKSRSIIGHFLREHRLAGVWENLIDKYAR